MNDLAVKVEKLAEIKVIAGENIRISETESGFLISAKEQELPEKLRQWLLETDIRLKDIPAIQAGRGIILEKAENECRISALHDFIPPVLSRAGRAAASENDFPFKVVQSAVPAEHPGQYAVTVLGYNEMEKRFFHNYLYAGTADVMIINEKMFFLNMSSWIFLEVGTSSGKYTANLKCAELLPPQSNTSYIVPIAYLHVSGSSLAITQLHYGNIEVTGRLV